MNKADQARLEEEVAWDMRFMNLLRLVNKHKHLPPSIRFDFARAAHEGLIDDDQLDEALEMFAPEPV